jgi:hypothetical protein
MGNYYQISMKFGSQTKTEIRSSKITIAEVWVSFQDGRHRRQFGKSSDCYKMGNYHPISLKIGTRTKKNMPSLKQGG